MQQGGGGSHHHHRMEDDAQAKGEAEDDTNAITADVVRMQDEISTLKTMLRDVVSSSRRSVHISVKALVGDDRAFLGGGVGFFRW